MQLCASLSNRRANANDGGTFRHNLINSHTHTHTGNNKRILCVCIEFESGIHAEIMQLSVAQQNQIVCSASTGMLKIIAPL